jgi:hypothetical protein
MYFSLSHATAYRVQYAPHEKLLLFLSSGELRALQSGFSDADIACLIDRSYT